MTRAELRYLGSTDVFDVTLDEYRPEDPENVCITVDAYIGEEGVAGEDIFVFMVCTVASLAARAREQRYLFAGNYLIVPRYDYGAIWRAISELCREYEGPDWHSVAQRLDAFGHWEFHGFDSEPPDSESGRHRQPPPP